MPMYTPTAPRVTTRGDDVPPMFRPSNQANLEPAEALNPTPSQSFLPGLGEVRPGNASGTGLDPKGEEALAQLRRRTQQAQKRSAQQINSRVKQLEAQMAKAQAKIDQAKATGVPLPRQRVRELRNAQDRARKIIAYLRKHTQKTQAGGSVLPPWQRKPLYKRDLQTRPLQQMRLIDPDRELSAPQTRQASVEGLAGVDGFTDWLTDTTAGVPNWAFLLGGGGLLTIVAMRKRRKKARS